MLLSCCAYECHHRCGPRSRLCEAKSRRGRAPSGRSMKLGLPLPLAPYSRRLNGGRSGLSVPPEQSHQLRRCQCLEAGAVTEALGGCCPPQCGRRGRRPRLWPPSRPSWMRDSARSLSQGGRQQRAALQTLRGETGLRGWPWPQGVEVQILLLPSTCRSKCSTCRSTYQ